MYHLFSESQYTEDELEWGPSAEAVIGDGDIPEPLEHWTLEDFEHIPSATR